MTTEKELEKLKEVFKNRHLKNLLINKSGEQRRNVNHVLDGRHENQQVIEVAYSILEEQRKQSAKRKSLLK